MVLFYDVQISSILWAREISGRGRNHGLPVKYALSLTVHVSLPPCFLMLCFPDKYGGSGDELKPSSLMRKSPSLESVIKSPATFSSRSHSMSYNKNNSKLRWALLTADLEKETTRLQRSQKHTHVSLVTSHIITGSYTYSRSGVPNVSWGVNKLLLFVFFILFLSPLYKPINNDT